MNFVRVEWIGRGKRWWDTHFPFPVCAAARKWDWGVTTAPATTEQGINMGRTVCPSPVYMCVSKRLVNTKCFIFRHQDVGSITADEYGSSRTYIMTVKYLVFP